MYFLNWKRFVRTDSNNIYVNLKFVRVEDEVELFEAILKVNPYPRLSNLVFRHGSTATCDALLEYMANVARSNCLVSKE
jgi:hypothetical protein